MAAAASSQPSTQTCKKRAQAMQAEDYLAAQAALTGGKRANPAGDLALEPARSRNLRDAALVQYAWLTGRP